MIALIIKSYFAILLPVTIGSLLIFTIGLYLILRNALSGKSEMQIHSNDIADSDLDAIAGEDVMATQLDLARAYVETGKNQLAKQILDYVIKQGSATQQDEARELLGLI